MFITEMASPATKTNHWGQGSGWNHRRGQALGSRHGACERGPPPTESARSVRKAGIFFTFLDRLQFHVKPILQSRSKHVLGFGMFAGQWVNRALERARARERERERCFCSHVVGQNRRYIDTACIWSRVEWFQRGIRLYQYICFGRENQVPESFAKKPLLTIYSDDFGRVLSEGICRRCWVASSRPWTPSPNQLRTFPAVGHKTWCPRRSSKISGAVRMSIWRPWKTWTCQVWPFWTTRWEPSLSAGRGRSWRNWSWRGKSQLPRILVPQRVFLFSWVGCVVVRKVRNRTGTMKLESMWLNAEILKRWQPTYRSYRCGMVWQSVELFWPIYEPHCWWIVSNIRIIWFIQLGFSTCLRYFEAALGGNSFFVGKFSSRMGGFYHLIKFAQKWERYWVTPASIYVNFAEQWMKLKLQWTWNCNVLLLFIYI